MIVSLVHLFPEGMVGIKKEPACSRWLPKNEGRALDMNPEFDVKPWYVFYTTVVSNLERLYTLKI